MKTTDRWEVLVIMARYPEEGTVKTRLAEHLGPRAACTLYRAFLGDLDDKFGFLDRHLIWYYTPPDSPFASLFPHPADCRPQAGSTLQERMLHVFEDLLREGWGRVVVIGSDVPHIRITSVDDAFEALRGSDVVLGPSRDGGYHLIGLSKIRDLFSGILMGVGTVCRETVDRARSLGLSCHCLDATFDIDTIDDLKRFAAFLEYSEDPLPRTREALREIMAW